LVVAPDHPAALEAAIELDDVTGEAVGVLGRLRAAASATPAQRRILTLRALRLARSHDLDDDVLALERELVAQDPADVTLAWRLEATLFALGLEAERAVLLGTLAVRDPDPRRCRTALLGAARIAERMGDAALAIERYRQLLALSPEDNSTRDTLIGLLRAQQRWADLVAERRIEARTLAEPSLIRRALREAAWVLEVRLTDVAGAASVYAEWLVQVPADRTALEGLARCRATLGDHDGEVTARATIAELDQTRWLHARSLERAARHDLAIAHYRPLIASDDAQVAATSATLAIGDLAARGSEVALRLEAAEVLAKRTSDPQFGAALFEECGWMAALALEDFERAEVAFSAALALQPLRLGALLGVTLVAACRTEPRRLGEAYVSLASAMATAMPEVAMALYLRAAAIAVACGEAEVALARIEAARVTAPEHIDPLFLFAELSTARPITPTDPFAAADRLLAHVDLLEKRGALTDPMARTAWELDRAEALELAGQLREASEIIAVVLKLKPDDRRAVAALRRIALRAGDRVKWAQASYALAGLSRDPALRLRLLREAADYYDR
ncbi:MAG: hypothetical protein NT062_38370, partial [Proteobacteria bacterium]|nr:hypothetical protein [Pseudomonadota bacterium]